MKKRNRSLWRKRAVCALVALSMCIPQIAGNGRLVLAAEDVPGQSEGLQAGAGWTEVQGGQTGTEQSETQVTEQTTETFEIQTSEFSTQVSESDTRAWGTEESGTDVTESETHITEAESQTSGTEESNQAWSETQSSESGTAGSESETQMSKPGETDLSEQETETEKTTEEDPAGDGEGAWQKLRGLFGSYMVAAAENVNASDDYFVGSTVTKYSFGREELPEGFYSVKLTVLSKKDGYSNKENDLRVRLSFSVSMDEDDFLYPKSEEFLNETSFPKQGSMSDEVWMTEVNGWLKDTNKNGGIVPPLVYTYDLRALGETDIQAEKLYAAGNAQLPVGSYELENGILKVTMDPILYFMHDISLKFSLDANIDGSKLPDDPQEAVLNDKGQLIFQAVGTADGNQGGTEAPKYFVEKEAPERVTDSRITYTLSVRAAEGEVLNGKTLVDVMPSVGGDDGYKLKIVSAALKEENGKDISRIIDGADSNNDFSYTFPKLNGAGSNKITSSTVELVLELDDDSYQRLIQNGSLRQSFKNKASLTEEGKTDPLAVSEEVTTQMNVTFIGKEGREANLEGSRFAWTINAKTSLPYMESGYLVDTLCWTDHSYDMAGGVQITYQDGQTGEVNTDFLTPVRIDAGSGEAVRWESLTVDTLDTLAGAAGQQAFYYLYDAVNEKGENIPNPFYRDGSEEPQYVQRAVLVIPYTKYKGPNEDGSGREVTIKYFTDLNQHGLSSKEYIDVLEEAKKNGYTSDISNKVNLLWRNKGGIGPVPPAQDSVDFGKKVDADPGSVIKRGVSYNPKTRSIEWAVDINKLGLNLKNVVLEDNLGSSSYDLGSLKIKYYEYTNTHDNDRSGELTKLEGTPDPSSAFGYTVENGTVKVYLGDLDGDSTGTYKYYTLSFVLTLKDTSLLGNQSSDQTISNEITLSAVHGDKEYSDTSQAQIKVPNTLIEKTAVGKYDYNKHEFQWKVTVNPNKVNLTWAVVTDTLEKGFAFGELSRVEIDGTESQETLDELKKSPEIAGDVAAGQTVTWKLGNIGKHTYDLYFTSTASDDWRNEHLKCETDTDGAVISQAVTVPNKAELTGKAAWDDGNGENAITNATASGSNIINPRPLTKRGSLDPETGRISWEVIANQNQYNISGLYLLEELNAGMGGKVIHELDPDSIKVYEMTDSTETGNEISTAESDFCMGAGGNAKLDASGFAYTFPVKDGSNYSTYKVTFDTYLTEEAEDAQASISNQVYLINKDGTTAETSKPDNGGFDFDKAADASPRPKIALRKISANSQDEGGKEENSLGLDAVFKLSGYGYTYEAGTGKLSVLEGTPLSKYDKIRSVTDGDAAFLNINPNNDIIYVLEESSAQGGYDLSSSSRYFLYFPKDASHNLDVKEIFFQGEAADAGYFKQVQYGNDGSGSPIPIQTITVTNKPLDHEFTFTKMQVDPSGYSYNGADGKKENKSYEAAPGVVFRVDAADDISDKIKTQYVTSDDTGKITLKNLDPGTYKLTEVKSNPNMAVGQSVKLTVAWSQEDGFTYSFSEAGGGISIDAADKTVLNDDFLRGNFSFTKYAGYLDDSDPASFQGKNREPISGVGFLLKGTVSGGPADSYQASAVSDTNGKVSFGSLPVGTYEVYETAVPGYKEYLESGHNVKVLTVEVKEEETSQDLVKAEDGTEYKEKRAAVTVTPVRDQAGEIKVPDTSGEIYNTPVKGTITFTKVLEETALSGLNGTSVQNAEFGLFRKIGGTTGKNPVYKAVSSEDGKVTFTDVEYGDYVLKETFVSEGYVSTISSNGLAISKKDLAGAFNKNDQDSPESFAYTFTQPSDGQSVVNSGTVVNKLYRAVIKFHKSDDDGNPLGDIKFDIFRRSPNAVSADGTGMQMKAEDTVTSYWKYGPEPAVISAADGNFQVTLPYGDYLLVENEPEDLTDGHNSEAIHSYKIKEIEAPFGFQLNRTDTGELTEVSFEIGEGEGVNGTLGGHEGTAWISISRDTGSAVYTSIGAPAPADSKAENTISRGSIALIKTNRADKEEDTMRLSGASFAVYAGVPGNAAEGEADSKTLAAMLTESPAEAGRYELSNQTADGKAINAKDSAGRRYLLDDGTGKLGLLSGDYYIEEQERPYGYLLSNVQTAFTLKDDGSIELKPAGNPPARLDESETGTIIFSDEKIWSDISLTNYYKGTDTVISNVAFTLYRINKDGAGTESEEAIETKVTDGNGTLVFEKVPEGEYRIKESLEESIKAGAPSDVYIDTAWSSEVIAVGTETHSTVINIGKVENESFRASVSLNKYDAENGDPIQDTVFLLERKEGENFVPVSNENGGYHKTDEKGQLKIDILKTGHYRLTETEAAPGYILNEGAGFFCEFDVTNAEFNEDIEIQSVNLAAGNYGMTAGNYEMTAGNNEAAGNDDTAADNGTADRAASLLTEKGLGNERKTGSVFLQKIGESEEILLNGVEFALYKKDAEGNYGELAKVLTGNSYSAADGYTVPVPAGEGKEGSLTITGLTWGDYRIRETKPLPGYKLNPAEFDFTIGRTTNEMKLEADLDKISNEANEITIVKQDEEGNPLEGAVFTVTKADEADIDAADTKNVTTGEDGTAVLTKELTGDTVYILHEETVPSGYLRADDVRFVMGMDGNIVPAEGETAGNIENNTITVTDRLTYLSFTKKSRIHEDCSDPELGVPSPDVVKPLEGVEFTIYAPAEPEEEPKEICRVYSDENGLAEKNGLPAGTYEIRETKPAEGYLANDTVYIAEIDPENGFTGLSIKGAEENSQVEDNCIINDVPRTDILFKKVDEQNPEKVIPGSVYGLFKRIKGSERTLENREAPQDAEMGEGSGQDLEEGTNGEPDAGRLTLIAKAVTDENGTLKFSGVLMGQEYVIKELKAPAGSHLSSEPITLSFEIDENGQVKITSFDDGNKTAYVDEETGEIVWREPPTMIAAAKTDDLGSPLAGAKLRVEDEEGTIIEEWVSGEEPHILMGVLTAGKKYILIESEALKGYKLAEPVEFTVEEKLVGPDEGFVQSISIVNTLTQMQIEKTDESGKPLEGAKLAVYEKETGKLAETVEGEVLSFVTGQERKTITGLAAGAYILREEEAPEGYDLAEDILFVMDEKGLVTVDGAVMPDNLLTMEDKKTPETEEPQTDESEAETNEPQTDETETGEPETSESETGGSETNESETQEPQTEKKEPESESGSQIKPQDTTEKPSDTNKSTENTKPETVKTDDPTDIWQFIILAVLAAAVFGGIFFQRKRRRDIIK